MNPLRVLFGNWLGRYLGGSVATQGTSPPSKPGELAAALRVADVLLVEGNTRLSVAVKYLTQSTWSHAALYVGPLPGQVSTTGEPLCLVEADVVEGVRATPLSSFDGLHTRICRPVRLSGEDCERVATFARQRIGHRYDLKNVFDLARYLLPTPPVPSRWRRRMLSLGSGDPTRAICSTLIAMAFQSVRYPILPVVEAVPSDDPACTGCVDEILHVRHHSLFVPRDFDVSPYFEIVKPTLVAGFDPGRLKWAEPNS